jgi:hypothetical protein
VRIIRNPLPFVPVKRKVDGWESVGGVWPHELSGADACRQLYYAILRQAVEVLVDRYNGRKHTGADSALVANQYWVTRQWVFESEPSVVSFVDTCLAVGVNADDLRALLESAGL